MLATVDGSTIDLPLCITSVSPLLSKISATESSHVHKGIGLFCEDKGCTASRCTVSVVSTVVSSVVSS